jgi:hypothetical protein
MFEKLSAKQLERKDIRHEATAIINREVRQVLASEFDDAAAQEKSQELSNGTVYPGQSRIAHPVSQF